MRIEAGQLNKDKSLMLSGLRLIFNCYKIVMFHNKVVPSERILFLKFDIVVFFGVSLKYTAMKLASGGEGCCINL